MSKIPIKFWLPIVVLAAIWWGLPAMINLQAYLDIKALDRMTDARDPKVISGSFWTSNLDCTYKNPPKYLRLATPSFTCEDAAHNVSVLRDRRFYFVPRSTAEDGPPYCLVNKPAPANSLAVAKEMVGLYCRDSPIRKALSLNGIL